jgi:hypothetical protein
MVTEAGGKDATRWLGPRGEEKRPGKGGQEITSDNPCYVTSAQGLARTPVGHRLPPSAGTRRACARSRPPRPCAREWSLAAQWSRALSRILHLVQRRRRHITWPLRKRSLETTWHRPRSGCTRAFLLILQIGERRRTGTGVGMRKAVRGCKRLRDVCCSARSGFT